MDTGLVSRSISFENPRGAPGEGGKAASELGVGRKGDPARIIKPSAPLPAMPDAKARLTDIWKDCYFRRRGR
ncbi:MAG: hypothetical protein IT426_15990 [Pirellulales bacterium]|nr:hypothetical protein [Pirellulales bacterium]